MPTSFINLTPHDINFNDGRVFKSTCIVARVSASFSPIEDDVCSQTFGDIVDLPKPAQGNVYIVSALVLSAAKAQGRTDCVAPATGHKDCKRDDAGHILSVPCFVR